MGIYNIIGLSRKCPNCGAKVEWQTKNLTIDEIYPVADVLGSFVFNERMGGEIHTFCNKCKYWASGMMKKGKIVNLKSKRHCSE